MTNTPKIGLAIIGTGSIADDCHAPAMLKAPNALLTAVLSRSRESGQQFSQKHTAGRARVYTSLPELLRDKDVHGVIVASPDRLHAEQALASLASGRHVLVEKPMATSLNEAIRLLAAAQDKKCVLMVGFHLRHHNGLKALRQQIVGAKKIGRVEHVRAIWAFPQKNDQNWRAGSEFGKWWSLAAVGAHCLDLARWIADDFDDWAKFCPVISKSKWRGAHDETAVISAELRCGTTVEIVSTVKFGPANRLEIYGSEGTAICDNSFGRAGGGQISLLGQELPFSAEPPFIRQVSEFADCIATHRTPDANGSIGLRNTKDLLLADDA